MYARFQTQKIPAGIQVLTPDNALKTIRYFKTDLNSYKAIHVIGDIHGCYTALQSLMAEIGGLQDDCYYIFCGDYISESAALKTPRPCSSCSPSWTSPMSPCSRQPRALAL